jgi:hypothetical protein
MMARKKSLLLAFDAFGTLYTPNVPIPQAYGRAALQHGIRWAPQKADDQLTPEDFEPVKKSFGKAFKDESARNPNYGKATGLGAEKWWANVTLSGTTIRCNIAKSISRSSRRHSNLFCSMAKKSRESSSRIF